MSAFLLAISVLGQDALGGTTDGTCKLGDIPLNDNCWWPNEFTWRPVAQTVTRTLTGHQVIEEDLRQAGRPITLDGLHLPLGTVRLLQSLIETADRSYTLTLPDGRKFAVKWAGDPMTAIPEEELGDNDNDTDALKFVCTLRWITI